MSFSTCVTADIQAKDEEKIRKNLGWEMEAKYWLQSPLYHRIGCQCPNVDNIDAEKTHVGREGFQLCLDVQNFAPNEISVRAVDGFIEVNAKHNEHEDEHRYRLPKEFNMEDVVSNISSDGILTIQAPRASTANKGQMKIQLIGPVRLHLNEKKCHNEEVATKLT